jgi:hypothetical protein
MSRVLRIPTAEVLTKHRRNKSGLSRHDVLVLRNTKHGLSKIQKREYRSWKDMRARCNNPNNHDFKDYGGRGIKVCERWNDFSLFFEDMGERPKGLTLDRIDVDKGYNKENCRWADHLTQANNKRNNRLISIDGVKKTLSQWCRIYGVEISKVRYRLKQGWEIKKAFDNMTDYRTI